MGNKRDAYVQQMKAKSYGFKLEIDTLTAKAEHAEARKRKLSTKRG